MTQVPGPSNRRPGRTPCRGLLTGFAALTMAALVLVTPGRALAQPVFPTDAAPSRLLRLLEETRSQRTALAGQLSAAEASIADLDRQAQAAQSTLGTRIAREEALQGRVADAGAAVDKASGQVSTLDVAHRLASVIRLSPPVAHPPRKGYGPSADAAKLRDDLAAARRALESAQRRKETSERNAAAASEGVSDARNRVARMAEQAQERAAAAESTRQQLEALNSDPRVTAALAEGVSAISGAPVAPGGLGLADIPADYLSLYMRSAASCPGLSWTVLAAIGSVETSHGRSNSPGVKAGANFAGAMGPMQFLAETWDYYGRDGNGDGRRDVYDPSDAVLGAAALLCANGAGDLTRLRSAIWNYNHADWYVEGVIELAARYGAAGGAGLRS